MPYPKYTSGVYAESSVTVSRKPIFWDVQYYLPDDIRDTLPLVESSKIHGIFLMGFYSDPQIGQSIEHGGYRWRIVDVIHYPILKGCRAQKGDRRVPRCVTEFIGPVQNVES